MDFRARRARRDVLVRPGGHRDVGDAAACLRRFWTDVRPVGRIDNGDGLDNREQGKPVWICRGQRAPWAELWPELKTLS
jgi:hypothetical protein